MNSTKRKKALMNYLERIDGLQFETKKEEGFFTAVILAATSFALVELFKDIPEFVRYHVSAMNDSRLEFFVEA